MSHLPSGTTSWMSNPLSTIILSPGSSPTSAQKLEAIKISLSLVLPGYALLMYASAPSGAVATRNLTVCRSENNENVWDLGELP